MISLSLQQVQQHVNFLYFSRKRYSLNDIIAHGKKATKKHCKLDRERRWSRCIVFLLRQGDYDITIVEESGKLGRDVNPFISGSTLVS